MDITQILKSNRHRRCKRKGMGPGSGNGSTAGRGNKGRGQHAGRGLNPLYEGGQMPLVRRLPKRGFSGSPQRKEYVEVNVGRLSRFEAGTQVGPEELASAGVVADLKDGVKILGSGEIKTALTVRAHRFSKSAREKIEAAGGTVELIEEPAYRIKRRMAEKKGE